MYQFKRTIALALAAVSSIGLLAFSSCSDGTSQEESNGLVAYYAFEEGRGSNTVESVSGKSLTIQNVYSQANQANLMKPASDPPVSYTHLTLPTTSRVYGRRFQLY